MPLKVRVDLNACEGNGKCEVAAPEVFRVGANDQSEVLLDEVPEALREKVEHAIRLCPRQAISWEES